MKTIRSEIIINAPAEKVWTVLTGFLHYPLWNPFITEVRGNAEQGARLKITVRLEELPRVVISATVRDFHPPMRFGWKVDVLNGLFEAHHFFEIQKENRETTRFLHFEEIGGLFASPALFLLEKRLHHGQLLMNESLRNHAEKAA